MCGIAGAFAYGDHAFKVDRGELLRIREAMIKRGPDGAGLWISFEERVGLARRKLPISTFLCSVAPNLAARRAVPADHFVVSTAARVEAT